MKRKKDLFFSKMRENFERKRIKSCIRIDLVVIFNDSIELKESVFSKIRELLKKKKGLNCV